MQRRLILFVLHRVPCDLTIIAASNLAVAAYVSQCQRGAGFEPLTCVDV